MKVLVLGASGQLGSAFKNEIFSNFKLYLISKQNIKLNNFIVMYKKIKAIKPQVIINFLAFTDVDRCEIDKKMAVNANSLFPAVISKISKKLGCFLIHFSTDYVFFNNDKSYNNELKQTNPKSIYGKTKKKGEVNIIKSKCNYIILRTSWIYSDRRKNFFNTISKLLDKDNEVINVVSDQWGAPTLAYDLAKAVKILLINIKNKKNINYYKNISGIYHISNRGFTNWYDFACVIAENFEKNSSKRINSVTSKEFGSLTKRPFNSKLDNSKIIKKFGIKLPNWKESLLRFIYEKKNK